MDESSIIRQAIHDAMDNIIEKEYERLLYSVQDAVGPRISKLDIFDEMIHNIKFKVL